MHVHPIPTLWINAVLLTHYLALPCPPSRTMTFDFQFLIYSSTMAYEGTA